MVWRRKRNEEDLEEHRRRKRVVKRKVRESRKNGPKVWVRIVKRKITKFGLGVNEGEWRTPIYIVKWGITLKKEK